MRFFGLISITVFSSVDICTQLSPILVQLWVKRMEHALDKRYKFKKYYMPTRRTGDNACKIIINGLTEEKKKTDTQHGS